MILVEGVRAIDVPLAPSGNHTGCPVVVIVSALLGWLLGTLDPLVECVRDRLVSFGRGVRVDTYDHNLRVRNEALT